MKKAGPLFFVCLWALRSYSQPSEKITNIQRPKLVVGIVVDQMRWDFLYRFYSLYSKEGGFKRMMNNGFSCDNVMVPYTPTVTAAGHACIYSGAVPATNGVVGNLWYDNLQNKIMYCCDDDSVKTIGASDDAGK